jgi:hypothetical protein
MKTGEYRGWMKCSRRLVWDLFNLADILVTFARVFEGGCLCLSRVRRAGKSKVRGIGWGISGMYVRAGRLWTWCRKKEGHMMTESC